MTEQETAILDFIRQSPESVFARKEIARKAIRRSEYEKDQHWADQPLAALVSQGLLETNDSGHYHLPVVRKLKLT